jgi:hypothetical protein
VAVAVTSFADVSVNLDLAASLPQHNPALCVAVAVIASLHMSVTLDSTTSSIESPIFAHLTCCTRCVAVAVICSHVSDSNSIVR